MTLEPVLPRPRPPGRRKNTEVRGREYLTADEVERLRRAALASPRHGHRNATMILLAYRHGLRATEVVKLRWDQVSLAEKTVYIRRAKGSVSGTHPLGRTEVAALKKLGGDRTGPVFRSERGGSLTTNMVHKIVARAGEKAAFTFPVHPHQLRHACGFSMQESGHDIRIIQAWLGHKNIQHTVRYTELSPERFRKINVWND